MLDLLIRNGQIIDGSGNPGYYGAVGVEGDTLHILRGDTSNVQAGRFIDATDHVVSPGFIDVHSHGGLIIIGEPRHEPKVRQGITTELVGIDGNSAAPFKTRCIDRTHGGQVFGDMVDTFKHKRLVPGGQSGKAY